MLIRFYVALKILYIPFCFTVLYTGFHVAQAGLPLDMRLKMTLNF